MPASKWLDFEKDIEWIKNDERIMNDMYLHITDFQMVVFFIINKLCRGLLEDNFRRFAFYAKNVQFIYDKGIRSVLSIKF